MSASEKHAKDSSQSNRGIFERDKAGETIPLDDPEYPRLFDVFLKAIRTTAELNTLVTDNLGKIRDVFSRLIGKTLVKASSSFHHFSPNRTKEKSLHRSSSYHHSGCNYC
jgi:hypothetical protein